MCKLDWKNNDLNADFIIVFVVALKNYWETTKRTDFKFSPLWDSPCVNLLWLKVDGTQSEKDNLNKFPDNVVKRRESNGMHTKSIKEITVQGE